MPLYEHLINAVHRLFHIEHGPGSNPFMLLKNGILVIIKTLDGSKAHGCDNISIKMTKICSQSLILPLKIIFKHSLKKGKFPDIWKKANVVPYIKKTKCW